MSFTLLKGSRFNTLTGAKRLTLSTPVNVNPLLLNNNSKRFFLTKYKENKKQQKKEEAEKNAREEKQLEEKALKTFKDESNDTAKIDQQYLQMKKTYGVITRTFIKPELSLLTFIKHPILSFQAIKDRLMTIGMDTLQVALFKRSATTKLQFENYRQLAMKTYVKVNSAFAKDELNQAHPYCSTWVSLALSKRRQKINEKDLQLDWKLIKFNKIPAIYSFKIIQVPEKPMELISVIYKFDTLQNLTIKNKKTGELINDKQQRVVDYYSFLIDTFNGEIYLQGKLPVNKLGERREKITTLSQHEIKSNCIKYSDIYA